MTELEAEEWARWILPYLKVAIAFFAAMAAGYFLLAAAGY